MQNLANLILKSSNMDALNSGIRSGQNIGSGFQNIYSRAIADRERKQQIRQQQAAAQQQQQMMPYQQKLADAKLGLMNAQTQRAMHPSSANSPYAVAIDPLGGGMHMYNKSTGKWVFPGQENTNNTPATKVSASSNPQQAVMTQQDNNLFPNQNVVMGYTPDQALQESQNTVSNFSPAYRRLTTKYAPKQETVTSPEGEERTVFTPTSAAVSQAEIRSASSGAMEAIKDKLSNTLSPYKGNWLTSRMKLQNDIIDYHLTHDTKKRDMLRERLSDFAAFMNNQNEISAMISKATSGRAPGEHVLEAQKKQLFSRLPSIPIDFPSDSEFNKLASNKMVNLATQISNAENEALVRKTNPDKAFNPKTKITSLGDNDSVLMKFPDGTVRRIPKEDVQNMIKEGGTING